MNTIRRTNRIGRIIRRVIFRMPEKKYFVSGDRACRAMMQNARRRQKPDSEEESILAWAAAELRAELRSGFWDRQAA